MHICMCVRACVRACVCGGKGILCVDTTNLLYKAEKPSVCLSVCLHCKLADDSAVSARIETGLAQNKSCVYEDHKLYFYKPIVPTIHRQECLEEEGVSSH